MKTTAQVNGIDKVLFVLFMLFYVMLVLITSAVLTGCAGEDITIEGVSTEQENRADIGDSQVSKQYIDNGQVDSQDSGDSDSSDTVSTTADINDSDEDAQDTQDGGAEDTATSIIIADVNTTDVTQPNVTDSIGAESDEESDEDSNSNEDSVSTKEDSSVSDSNVDDTKLVASADITAQLDTAWVKDTININDVESAKDTQSVKVADTIKDVESVKDTVVAQQPDITTISQDIISDVKEVVSSIMPDIPDVIADTGESMFMDIITDMFQQKADTVNTPDTSVQDTEVSTQDVKVSVPDTQVVPPPDIAQLNDGTTWYTSKQYQYKVQFPSWVEASQLKTTDLLLKGNSANKTGLTQEQLGLAAHFTLRTEFEYTPSYVGFDEWWKYLYGKPDEVATYQGQTLKYHSADSGGGFNRYTYVKIGKIGALRIEMSFSMPEHLFVDGFMEKSLEVLYMVTKSAQAVN